MVVGIVGSGQLGVGISQTFLNKKGYEILLSSKSIESAQKGVSKVIEKLALRREKGSVSSDEYDEMVSRVRAVELCELSECPLVIEAVTEDYSVKQDVFRKLDAICCPSCVLASNTSSLSISTLSTGIRHPVVGMHFFNPAPVMKLVEIVTNDKTAQETVRFIQRIAEDLGKKTVIVRESPGFVVNRLLISMINEAVGLVADGVASVEDIDRAMKFGANHPMGPLRLGDLIGLDVCLAILKTIQNETGNKKYAPHPLMEQMVANGKLGVKTNEGFYKY